MKPYCLRVEAPYACFTRPEMKVERVSYDVATPSSARAVFEAILWKPAIRWRITRIDVLRPIRFTSVRRNEVGNVISSRNVEQAMKAGHGSLGLFIEEERQQRAGLILRDVAYRLHATLDLLPGAGEGNTLPKFMDMFERRVAKGQCFNQPYLGTREFSCDFRFTDEHEVAAETPIPDTRELGYMLYDLDFSNANDPKPRFFRAAMNAGSVSVPAWESPEVAG